MGSLEVDTPRASLESENVGSSRDPGSATRTLLNTSSALLSDLSIQEPKKGEMRIKIGTQGNRNIEQKRKLRADILADLECEARKTMSGLTCMSLPMKQQLCMNMLSNGKPKAFIEFFSLTHSEGPKECSDDNNVEPKGTMDVLPPEVLSSLSYNLVEAEVAGRNGDYEKLSHVNFTIAKIFEDCKEYEKAVFYYSRCLSNSKQTRNYIYEAEVKFSLGKVYVKLGDCFIAIKWFEDYLQFARESQNNDTVVLGSKHLLEVYQMYAHEARTKGELEKSIELYQKCIKMAEVCGDSRAKAEAKHDIGLLHQELSRFDLAIQYQTEYLEYCSNAQDQVGESKAHSALAKTQELTGQTTVAIQHLEALLQVSQYVDLKTQATACCKLGMIYTKQLIYEKSLTYFEMFFKMACTLKDPQMIDAARVNLGFVRNALRRDDLSCSMQHL